MDKGIVKWFDNKKGYGFIVYNDGEEIFVHFTAIEGDGFKSLTENQPVEFEVMQGTRGQQAAHVKKLDETNN